ncbi:MAG: SDR family NAD(P)-dependent oxidoreductase [Alphaproteobacteria bacterium]
MEPIQQLSRSIKGQVAIITGAASGMGRATAHLFAAEGAKVALVDLNAEGVQAVADEIGEGAIAFALDVADADGIKRVVAETVEKLGGLNILVNNAGLNTLVLIEGDDAEYENQWTRAMDVMLTSHQRFIRAALPHLRAAGDGRIVNVASTEGLGATPGNSTYVAAKHGVIGLTRAVATELGREGITCNAICPGPIVTGITAGIPSEHKEIFAKRRVPTRRYGIPEEVAHITLSCVLPAASYLNGVAIPVDGGMTIKNA